MGFRIEGREGEENKYVKTTAREKKENNNNQLCFIKKIKVQEGLYQ